MENCWVIVADGASARFLSLEHNAGVPKRAEYRLVTAARLSNPEHTVAGRRANRKIKSGRDSAGHIAPHGYTDKREPHEAEILRRFSSIIAEQAEKLRAEGKASSLVLVAEPRMLGFLRAAFLPAKKAGATLSELAHDYTWCTAPQLYKHLAEHRLVPVAR